MPELHHDKPYTPNRFRYTLSALLILVLTGNVWAQKDLNEANKLYDKLAYADAIPKYKDALSKDTALYTAKVRLAECYRLTGNYAMAEQWYARVVKDKQATRQEHFYYGQMLMSNGKYPEARKWLEMAERESPGDERAGNFISSINGIQRFFSDSANYTIRNLPINGDGNDFGAAWHEKGIVYTASKQHVAKSRQHSWTGESFTNLYYADSATGAKAEAKPFTNEIQRKLNNGPVSFTIDGKKVYNTVNTDKVKDASKDLYKLSIIESTHDGKRWGKPVAFVYNNAAYNVAHPAVTSDGNRLYFSSDMPGGEGGMDLYYCDRGNNNSWSTPVNLGKTVNTPGNEVFPFIHANGILYFASNGHEGLGGLDVYATQQKAAGWEAPINIGYPVNTRNDDFGLILSVDLKTGYFSSNRPGGKGGDDIYHFTYNPNYLTIRVLDGGTQQPVPNASVSILDKTSGKPVTRRTDVQGELKIPVQGCRTFEVIASKEGFPPLPAVTHQTTCGKVANDKLDIVLAGSKLRVNVVDKGTGKPLSGVDIELREAQTQKVIATGDVDAFAAVVKPCTDYVVSAARPGMPLATSAFKTSCTPKEETVKMSMGLAPPDPNFIGGKVIEQGTTRALDSATAVVYDVNNIPLTTIMTASDGTFSLAGFKNVGRLAFFRQGFFSVTKVIATEPNRKEILVEMPRLVMDKVIQLEGIYYDVGKFTIRPDAAHVLDNVVKVMQENPTLEIELSAHTDARGDDTSNMSLSDKRAKAAAAYIVSKGIAESRIKGKGYGESLLKNNCGNGVKCTDKQHQENRRTEVKITKY